MRRAHFYLNQAAHMLQAVISRRKVVETPSAIIEFVDANGGPKSFRLLSVPHHLLALKWVLQHLS